MCTRSIFFKTILLFLPVVAVSFTYSVANQKTEKWFNAVKKGNIIEVKKLLRSHPEDKIFDLLSATNKYGQTVLYLASNYHHPEITETLLQHCPQDKIYKYISMQAKNGKTALHAAHYFVKNKDAKTEKTLLKYCPQDRVFEYLSIQDENGQTALHTAIRDNSIEMVDVLLEHCPQDKIYMYISAQDNTRQTALHTAASHRLSQLIKTLLKACPPNKIYNYISIQDETGSTALHLAVLDDRFRNIETLLEYCPQDEISNYLSIQDQNGQTAFDLAINVANEFDFSSEIEDYRTIKTFLAKSESAIFSISENGKGVITATINRNIAQDIFRLLKNMYENLKNESEVDFFTILNAIKESLFTIFAYCIFDEEKIHTITEAEKQALNRQVEALLDNDTETAVPTLISDYFKVLTKQQLVNEYKQADIGPEYFGTPWQLHFEITTQKLNKGAFKPTASKDLLYMQKNLKEAREKGYFSDI
ncbi:MAG: hypothetical protein UV79_C0022G0006 [candidate division TM6 bacterium GW2011_GWF2_43_17]|nr:MAG: hypothetical protein UV79_C0022G0006 [candidate division TM6 bacterium GW2011_GWF2_43_17]HAU30267.1 hypothetical protein [Candidatus Dependentiae bacterium]